MASYFKVKKKKNPSLLGKKRSNFYKNISLFFFILVLLKSFPIPISHIFFQFLIYQSLEVGICSYFNDNLIWEMRIH